LRGRTAALGGAMAYVCRGFTCDLPTSDPGMLAEQLDHASVAHTAPTG
jgi:hypothetical protein